MLRVALAETTSELEFYNLLHQMLREDDYLKTEYRWSLLQQQMSEHHGARNGDWRVTAKRLIEYLPGYYGYKSDWQDGDERKGKRG